MGYVIQYLFYAIPVAAFFFFLVSLCLYLDGRSKNKNVPGSVPAEKMKRRKMLLMVSSVIMGVFVAVMVALMALLYMAVAFM